MATCLAALFAVGCDDTSDLGRGVDEPAGMTGGRSLGELGLTRRVPDDVRHACSQADDKSSLHATCPPVVPKGRVEVNFVQVPRRSPDSYTIDMTSPRLENPSGDHATEGHWIVAASGSGSIRGAFQDREARVRAVRRRKIQLREHPARALWLRGWEHGGGYNAGHVAIWWRQDGISYYVSVHGHRHFKRVKTMARALASEMSASN